MESISFATRWVLAASCTISCVLKRELAAVAVAASLATPAWDENLLLAAVVRVTSCCTPARYGEFATMTPFAVFAGMANVRVAGEKFALEATDGACEYRGGLVA